MMEMIIVVAIMAIVVGGVFVGVGLITGKPAEKCANKLVSFMQRNRVTTMGKLDSYLEIYMEADGGKQYLCVKEFIKTEDGAGYVATQTRIGEADVEVWYSTDGTSYVQLGTSPLKISYDRSSGAFKDCCKKIEIKKGNKTVVLELVQRTGKIIMTVN